jgi:hypothetical protein
MAFNRLICMIRFQDRRVEEKSDAVSLACESVFENHGAVVRGSQWIGPSGDEPAATWIVECLADPFREVVPESKTTRMVSP